LLTVRGIEGVTVSDNALRSGRIKYKCNPRRAGLRIDSNSVCNRSVCVRMQKIMKVSKIPTSKKLQWIIKRMSPEQIKLIQPQITDVFAQYKRSQFKVIRGGSRRNK
jgi:hypothetical protein